MDKSVAQSVRVVATPRARRSQLLLHVLAYLALGIGTLVMIVPFLWMISSSVKADSDVLAFPPAWIPPDVEWRNYLKVLVLLPFGRYLVNTTVVSITVTTLEVLTSSLAAYSFARLQFPGRDRLFLLYLGTLMVPGQVTIIPNFLLVSLFGWVNTYTALIIPAAFTAFGTFLLRQFFLTIPVELEHAARIDGCGYLG
ncbi:MAG TPA: carbohydrate ABC transporter permease, partial [Chloroflexota bacterium]|nr:carbohydrate ABC transporter permease [Chloroflexota bacterium]